MISSLEVVTGRYDHNILKARLAGGAPLRVQVAGTIGVSQDNCKFRSRIG
jgi:hypothetical protein